MEARLGRASLYLLAIVAFVTIGFAAEDQFGISMDTTYRLGCAGLCLSFIYKLQSDYPGERWTRIALAVALLVDLGLFFTPLVNRPASRGEVMVFAVPDVIVVLLVRLASYPVADEHQRAMRQQMILALILAVAFCAIAVAVVLTDPHSLNR